MTGEFKNNETPRKKLLLLRIKVVSVFFVDFLAAMPRWISIT
jgi:hypothetical protein